jgi:hypothetical protein
LSNCSCTAYSYGQGGCSVWHGDLTNVAADDSGEILYLRLAAKEVQSWKDHKHGMIISVSVAVGVSTVTLAFIFLIVIWRSSKRSTACSLELSAAYFQPASSVFFSHKSANSTFSHLFSAQANKPLVIQWTVIRVALGSLHSGILI